MTKPARSFDITDRLFGEIDKIIKILTVPASSSRPLPLAPESALSEPERTHSARLMRVNHAGEIAAQALYQGQALTARSASTRASMQEAAAEEKDHLAWCETRLKELQGHTSVLNPLWYVGSFTIGAAAGALGDATSLGFIAETEKQVEMHLSDHLQRLSHKDLRSRAIIDQMRSDEVRHGEKAASLGGKPLPFAVAILMRATSRLMTKASFWV
jgi:3-demethoxyubiquinol 3-hydroxylase